MSKKRKILMVVANPAVSTTTGWPVGFWASELIHPYDAFVRQGYEVTIASPKGGKVQLDAYSDPRDGSGYSKDDSLSLQYLGRSEFVALLERTAGVSDWAPKISMQSSWWAGNLRCSHSRKLRIYKSSSKSSFQRRRCLRLFVMERVSCST